ncbi:unnamed protein product [Owenia fusiformis]|uniref:Uncharacterized protein n=1 Tax=Owenia fusiformis TaxID=6347 RepID=A0A8S4PYJ2_OWEFU|nr:unnamed protein product [Owenia fusiformis]
MKALVFCCVLLAFCFEQHTMELDRCGNAECEDLIITTADGVEFESCPEIKLGFNCSERAQFAMTVDKYKWDNTACEKLGVEWKYAVDFEDDERFLHVLQVATKDSWIGLKKMDANTWAHSVWLDGTPYNNTWNRWDEGEDDVDTNCLALDAEEWLTDNCTTEQPVLCQKVFPCDNPSPLDDNANVTDLGSVETYYYSVAYTCDTGFFIGGNASIPSETIRCKNNVWDDHTPCEYPQCSNPPSDIHANLSVSSTLLNISTIATYVCHDGYSIGGGLNRDYSENMTCLVGGQWSITHVHCKKKSCGAPEEYNGANVTYSGTLYKDVAQYVCRDGFERNNSIYIVECLSNTSWSYAPKCEAIDCGIAPVYSNTHIIYENGTKLENTIRYGCDFGYEMEPSIGETQGNITCQATGKWTSLHTMCQRKNCGNPINDPNAVTVVNGTLYKDIVRYNCNIGYVQSDYPSMDIRNVSCLGNGTWEYHALCKPVDCGDPPIDSNAAINISGTLFNDFTQYKCNSGYVLSDITHLKAHNVSCLGNGTWEYHALCKPVDCGDPPIDSNAVINISGTLFNDFAQYKCNSGYVLSDITHLKAHNVSCLSNGAWEYHALCTPCGDRGQWHGIDTCVQFTPVPSCSCGNLEEDPNAIPVDPNIQVYKCSSFATLRCKDGYHIDGRSENSIYEYVHCLQNGTWSSRSYCISVNIEKWVRAKKVEFIPEEAAGATLIGSFGLCITITSISIVFISDLRKLYFQFKNRMSQNLCFDILKQSRTR